MSIDAKSIVRIIKACKASGVLELKLGEMEIKFGPGDAAKLEVQAGDAVKTPTDQELKEVTERVEVTEMLDRADEELVHMQVENPALFEELLVQRELEGREVGNEEHLFD